MTASNFIFQKDDNDKDSVEEERPPMDLFKAIFADSDSSDAEELNEPSDEERISLSSEHVAATASKSTNTELIQVKIILI